MARLFRFRHLGPVLLAAIEMPEPKHEDVMGARAACVTGADVCHGRLRDDLAADSGQTAVMKR